MAVQSEFILKYGETDVNDNLATVLNGVVENVQTRTVSELLKNKNGSGDPEGGTIEYKRFANSVLRTKGTARLAGKGDDLVSQPVLVNLSDNKEIVEELQIKDVKLFGIAGMAEKRAENFARRIAAYLDRAFFGEAVSAGTQFTRGTLTDKKDIVDAMIVQAKTVSSDFIDGIDAEDLAIVLSADYTKAMKNELDLLPNGTVASNGLIGRYDGIDTFESNRLGTGVQAVVMLKGAIAQPYLLSEYNAEKINLDDVIALQNFLYTGVEALSPEAIIYDKDTTVSA